MSTYDEKVIFIIPIKVCFEPEPSTPLIIILIHLNLFHNGVFGDTSNPTATFTSVSFGGVNENSHSFPNLLYLSCKYLIKKNKIYPNEICLSAKWK